MISKRKTPKWLENRDNQSANTSEKQSKQNDDKLEKDRQAFLEKLNKNGRKVMSDEKLQKYYGSSQDLDKRIEK